MHQLISNQDRDLDGYQIVLNLPVSSDWIISDEICKEVGLQHVRGKCSFYENLVNNYIFPFPTMTFSRSFRCNNNSWSYFFFSYWTLFSLIKHGNDKSCQKKLKTCFCFLLKIINTLQNIFSKPILKCGKNLLSLFIGLPRMKSVENWPQRLKTFPIWWKYIGRHI